MTTGTVSDEIKKDAFEKCATFMGGRWAEISLDDFEITVITWVFQTNLLLLLTFAHYFQRRMFEPIVSMHHQRRQVDFRPLQTLRHGSCASKFDPSNADRIKSGGSFHQHFRSVEWSAFVWFVWWRTSWRVHRVANFDQRWGKIRSHKWHHREKTRKTACVGNAGDQTI